MALSFDLLTALTVSGILTILAVYFIVVFKKGWLRGESRTDQAYYLCPNQRCRRVFKKPVWLTDLSRTPPESYQACPHCGFSIQAMSSSNLQPSPISSVASQPSPSRSDVGTSSDRPPFTRSEAIPTKASVKREPFKSDLQVDSPKEPERPENGRAPKSIFQSPQIQKETPQKQTEAPKKIMEKNSSQSPKKCSHFFGYVRTLPKNTAIPDECLWCPSIVDCLTHETKVEAEA